jgi:hypothetical protein
MFLDVAHFQPRLSPIFSGIRSQGNEVSERQWNDVVGMIKVQGANLNVEYMQRTAADIGVLDLLQRLLNG